MDTSRRLAYLVALAEERHFARAAARLGIAQPSLSQQIARLEADLGVTLVDRSVRPVRMTDAGTALVQRVAPALRTIARAVAAVRVDDADRTLRIALPRSQYLRHPPVAAMISGFRTALPGWEVDVVPRLGGEAMAGVADRTLDVAVVYSPVFEDDVEVAPLFMDSPVVLMPPDHPLAARNDVVLDDLRHETLVTWSSDAVPGMYDVVLGACARLGFQPATVEAEAEPGALGRLVAGGAGVALVSRVWAQVSLTGSLVTRPLRRPAFTLSVVATWSTHARPAVLHAVRSAVEAAGAA